MGNCIMTLTFKLSSLNSVQLVEHLKYVIKNVKFLLEESFFSIVLNCEKSIM